MMEVFAAVVGDGCGCGMTEPCLSKKGVVENSETTGCAFLATGLRVAGMGAVIETGFGAATGIGFMGDKSGGATSSSDVFRFSAAVRNINNTRTSLLLLECFVLALFFLEFSF